MSRTAKSKSLKARPAATSASGKEKANVFDAIRAFHGTIPLPKAVTGKDLINEG